MKQRLIQKNFYVTQACRKDTDEAEWKLSLLFNETTKWNLAVVSWKNLRTIMIESKTDSATLLEKSMRLKKSYVAPLLTPLPNDVNANNGTGADGNPTDGQNHS